MNTDLMLGVATCDITPPVGTMMSGYHLRKSASVGFPLRAECFSFEDVDGGCSVLISADVIGFSQPFAMRVRKAIADDLDIDKDAVLLCATHTHSGPPSNAADLGLIPDDQPYMEDFAVKLVELAQTASVNRKPVSMSAGWCDAGDHAHIRRTMREDGAIENVWADPNHAMEVPSDTRIMVVRFTTDDGNTLGTIVGYGCHPVTLGPNSFCLHADYVGVLKRELEGQGMGTVMFLLRGHGEVDPRICVGNDTSVTENLGKELAQAVLDGQSKLAVCTSGPVRTAEVAWSFTRTNTLPGRDGMPEMPAGETLTTQVNGLRVGDLVIIGYPGELFNVFNRQVGDLMPSGVVTPISLCNGYNGYLTTDKCHDEGGYEAGAAPASGLEQAIMGNAKQLVQQLFE